jgi:23S rRNA pseudouridine1911/1915/1917 synthase
VVFAVPAEADGVRADRVLADRFPDESRARVAVWIKDGRVRVEGRAVRPSTALTAGQSVEVEVPAPPIVELAPQPVPLDVVYADDAVIVVDKAAGVVVHPGAGNPDATVLNGLLHRFGALSNVGAPERPGVVHRIDAGTSGLLVFARTDAAHQHLARQFAAHTIDRRYLALAWDHGLADEGVIETTHARDPNDRRRFTGRTGHGKRAVTHWTVLERLPPCVWVEVRLETGRTHQIRVHFAEAGHPLVGDATYGRRRRVERPPTLRHRGFELGLERQALHAARLGFEHPDGRHLVFDSPVPADIAAALDALRAGAG